RDPDAEQRQRPRPREHPQRQPPVHRSEPAMADGAERLEDRAVHDVGADCVGRVEAEDDDEDRGHQRPAAHAGQPDERADQEAGEAELPGHEERTIPAATVSFVASSTRMKAPVSRLSTYGSTASGSDRRRRTIAMSFSS